MSKFVRAARRATATFIFATMGLLVGSPIFDMDAKTWKVIACAGLGAVGNLLFRWSEAVLKEPEPVDLPGGPIAPGN